MKSKPKYIGVIYVDGLSFKLDLIECDEIAPKMHDFSTESDEKVVTMINLKNKYNTWKNSTPVLTSTGEVEFIKLK